MYEVDTDARMYARCRPWRYKRRVYSSLYVSAIMNHITQNIKYKYHRCYIWSNTNICYVESAEDVWKPVYDILCAIWVHKCVIFMNVICLIVEHIAVYNMYFIKCISILERGCMSCEKMYVLFYVIIVENGVLWLCRAKSFAQVSHRI